MSSGIILNIPHSSTFLPLSDIPLPFRDMALSATEKQVLQGEIRKRYIIEREYMTDWYTDELYNNGIGKPLFAPVSRLLCDMERFRDDMKEEMSRVGMGVCYTRTHDLDLLAEYSPGHREEIIRKYYLPYHQMLTNYVSEAIAEHKCALLIDCHSFSGSPYLCDRNQSPKRPDICIGTDPDNTPEDLTATVKDYFENLGYSVKLNCPFSGTITPEEFYKDPRLLSIMIEVNRKLYLEWKEEKVIKKEEEFKLIKNQIYELEKILENFMAEKSLRMGDNAPVRNKIPI